MSRIIRAVILSAAITACASVSAAPPLPTVSSTQSAVTVKATPRSLQGDVWDFDVVFDTHSQELKDDLIKSAVLVPTDGSNISPIEWKGDPPGGHHRQGVLRFNAIRPSPASLELRIERAGESKPRSFSWSLQ
ncbi:hypothetical protein EGT07_11005 [Herbaspirillum sp. HC18]|nr:hypothetical protein EGT07_11005 [Herbaspirillum sp. HC18]